MASNETLNVSLGPTETTGKTRRAQWSKSAHSEGLTLGTWIRDLCDREATGAGRRANPKWTQAAVEMGYTNTTIMIREVVDWVLAKAVWKRGHGIVGFKK